MLPAVPRAKRGDLEQGARHASPIQRVVFWNVIQLMRAMWRASPNLESHEG